jgi:hypothetical protein
LLAHLNFTYICQQATAYDISTALQELHTISSDREEQLGRVYDRAIETIRRGPKRNVELALRTLSWLSHAKTTLKVEELRIAVSIEKDQPSLNPESLLTAERLADLCAGLVIIETSSMDVRLAHYTTQEYLMRKAAIPQHLRGGYHANVCATYLTMDRFKPGACETSEALLCRYRDNAFLRYALRYLKFHIAPSDDQATADSVARFVQHPGCVSSYLQANAYLMINVLLLQTADQYPKRYTALHIASRLGHEGVARLCIDQGADVSAVDYQGRMPLHHAAFEGHEGVARLCIDQGADISAVDKYGRTPVSMAARFGHKEFAQLLIDMGADSRHLGY